MRKTGLEDNKHVPCPEVCSIEGDGYSPEMLKERILFWK
jgi:hypothetical protein